jgi:hypothetical protein
MLDEDLDMAEDLDEYNNDETIQHFARKKREGSSYKGLIIAFVVIIIVILAVFFIIF